MSDEVGKSSIVGYLFVLLARVGYNNEGISNYLQICTRVVSGESAYARGFYIVKQHMHYEIWCFRLLLILVVVVELWALVCVLYFDDKGFSDSVMGDLEIYDTSIS